MRTAGHSRDLDTRRWDVCRVCGSPGGGRIESESRADQAQLSALSTDVMDRP
jgi:hypothetical protein